MECADILYFLTVCVEKGLVVDICRKVIGSCQVYGTALFTFRICCIVWRISSVVTVGLWRVVWPVHIDLDCWCYCSGCILWIVCTGWFWSSHNYSSPCIFVDSYCEWFILHDLFCIHHADFSHYCLQTQVTHWVTCSLQMVTKCSFYLPEIRAWCPLSRCGKGVKYKLCDG